MSIVRHVPRCILAIQIGVLSIAMAVPAKAQSRDASTRAAASDTDAFLVQRTIWYINAQLPPARRAVDQAAFVGIRTLIVLAMTGASDAEILAHSAETPYRLDSAAAPFVDRAHLAVDSTFRTLQDRHGSVPAPYGETLGAAILTFDSDVAVRVHLRWAAIDALAAWLTR